MSDQIKTRIKVLDQERQQLLAQINASPAVARVQQLTGAILELEQMLPKGQPTQSTDGKKTDKVVKFPKRKLGGGE